MGLWRVEEAAEYLGIRPKTLYEWVRTDRVPYRKIGFNVRFDPTELEAWTEAQARGPEEEAGARTAADETGEAAAEELARLRALAADAAAVLRRLQRDLGTHLSYPQRQRIDELLAALDDETPKTDR